MKPWLRPLARQLLAPILRYALDTPVIMGDHARVSVGERSALANTIFNVSSGDINIGNRVIFSPNVMVLTGRHDFVNGMRVSVNPEYDDGSWGGSKLEVPSKGFDISIEDGVWIGAGAIILGAVVIGPNSIVSAGAVVTNSFPENSIIAGIPAKSIGSTLDRKPTSDQISEEKHDASN
ncbi:acyltransferase [Actinomycetota bacterium]|nr:acyltransferase [Actinomycetota bacterium]